jgi:hemolysin activation/secretion protein
MTWSGRLAPVVALAALLPLPVLAQAVPQDPARLLPNLSPVPPGSPLPRILPDEGPAPGAGVPLPGPVEATPVPDINVRVASVRVEGVTAYPAGRLAAITEGLAGPAVPLARIEAARLALLRLYREDGYVLTSVSAELDAAGTLRLAVTEGRIAEVRLDGDIGPAATQVLLFLERLVTPGPIDQARLERQLLLAQEVPGVALRAVLRRMPGGDPGALQLVAQVSRTAWSAVLAADNRAFRLVGPEQAVAGVSLNSFTQFGERTEFVLFRSIDGTQTFGQAGAEAFLGGSGLRLRVAAGTGNSKPSGNLAAIGYEGLTTTASATLTYPLVRRRGQLLNIFAMLDAIDSEVRLADVRASLDSVRAIRAGMEYGLQDIWLGPALPASNAFALRFSQGLNALGASRADDALAGRFGQTMDFFKMTGEVSRAQALFSPWEGASVSVFGLVAGQWSNDVLPPVEKFPLGGLRLNRGFYAGEVTGDKALSTSVELRLDDGYRFNAFGRSFDLAAQYYAFYDWGQSWENLSTDLDRRLSSTGLGLRLTLDRTTDIQLEGVQRLTRRPQGPQSQALDAQAFYWRVVTRF